MPFTNCDDSVLSGDGVVFNGDSTALVSDDRRNFHCGYVAIQL